MVRTNTGYFVRINFYLQLCAPFFLFFSPSATPEEVEHIKVIKVDIIIIILAMEMIKAVLRVDIIFIVTIMLARCKE